MTILILALSVCLSVRLSVRLSVFLLVGLLFIELIERQLVILHRIQTVLHQTDNAVFCFPLSSVSPCFAKTQESQSVNDKVIYASCILFFCLQVPLGIWIDLALISKSLPLSLSLSLFLAVSLLFSLSLVPRLRLPRLFGLLPSSIKLLVMI